MFFIAVFRWPVAYNLRICLRQPFANLCLSRAYAAKNPFCFQLSHDVLLWNVDAGSYSLIDDEEEEVDDPEEEKIDITTN